MVAVAAEIDMPRTIAPRARRWSWKALSTSRFLQVLVGHRVESNLEPWTIGFSDWNDRVGVPSDTWTPPHGARLTAQASR